MIQIYLSQYLPDNTFLVVFSFTSSNNKMKHVHLLFYTISHITISHDYHARLPIYSSFRFFYVTLNKTAIQQYKRAYAISFDYFYRHYYYYYVVHSHRYTNMFLIAGIRVPATCSYSINITNRFRIGVETERPGSRPVIAGRFVTRRVGASYSCTTYRCIIYAGYP